MLDCAAYIRLSVDDRIDERPLEREVRRNRRRERAAGPMRVRRMNAHGLQFREEVSVEQQVDDLVALGVPTGDHDGGRAHLMDLVRRGPRVLDRVDAAAAQYFGL